MYIQVELEMETETMRYSIILYDHEELICILAMNVLQMGKKKSGFILILLILYYHIVDTWR